MKGLIGLVQLPKEGAKERQTRVACSTLVPVIISISMYIMFALDSPVTSACAVANRRRFGAFGGSALSSPSGEAAGADSPEVRVLATRGDGFLLKTKAL